MKTVILHENFIHKGERIFNCKLHSVIYQTNWELKILPIFKWEWGGGLLPVAERMGLNDGNPFLRGLCTLADP